MTNLTPEQSIEQARELQAQGQIEAAKQTLNSLLAGGVQQASRHKNIKIFRRSASLSSEQRLIIGRCLVTLINLQAVPQQLLSDLNQVQSQIPELENTPEVWLLKGEIAWKLEQLALAQTCFQQARILLNDPSAGQWPMLYLPLCHDLLYLRLALLALGCFQNEDADRHFQALRSGQREFTVDLLQKIYGEFILDPLHVHVSEIDSLVLRFGLIPANLRLLKQFLNRENVDRDTLFAQVFKVQSSSLERRFLTHLIQGLEATEQTALYQQALHKNWQAEWAYALGELYLLEKDPTKAYEVWSRIWLQPQMLPIYILRGLARYLQQHDFQAEARRCLQLALSQHMGEAWLADYKDLLLNSVSALTSLYQLIVEPDWANGGDLAIKTMIQTFSADDPILFHIPANWSSPLVQQALQWAYTLPVDKLPAIWCGDLPAEFDELRKVRLAPWRLPIQQELSIELEIQPQPEEPHLGPLYYLSQDPQQAGLWLESDSYSLSRWLNAARWHNLPISPLLNTYGLNPKPAKISFLFERRESLKPEFESLLKQLGCQILIPGPLQTFSDLLPLAKGEWVFYLGAYEELTLSQMLALQAILISLPPQIDALVFSCSHKILPAQSWPVIRCIRRLSLQSLNQGEFCPVLDSHQGDLSLWYLPEIQILKSTLNFLNPLDLAWQAYQSQNFESAQGYLQEADLLWPLSQQVQVSLQELRLAMAFAQHQFERLCHQRIQFPSAMSYYWQAKAALVCGQKQTARAFFEQSLEAYDQLQPTYLSLLPSLSRDVLKAACSRA